MSREESDLERLLREQREFQDQIHRGLDESIQDGFPVTGRAAAHLYERSRDTLLGLLRSKEPLEAAELDPLARVRGLITTPLIRTWYSARVRQPKTTPAAGRSVIARSWRYAAVNELSNSSSSTVASAEVPHAGVNASQ